MKYYIVYIDRKTYTYILIDENKCLWKASRERIEDNMIDGEISDCMYKEIKEKDGYIEYPEDVKIAIYDFIENNMTNIVIKNNKIYEEIDLESFLSKNKFIDSLPFTTLPKNRIKHTSYDRWRNL